MKHLLFAACLLITISAFSQKKLALIVAVGKYLPESGIPTIASVNDIKYIKAVLKNNGFAENNIDTLVDSKATKKAILDALDRLSKSVKSGDVVLIHFSCHGQQIRDQKTVELGMDEEDGLDEALLPYDVKKGQYFPGVYTGENHLRDDELGLKLIAIRNALGKSGSLLVLIDACHSGTATRAEEFTSSRGEPEPFLDPSNPMQYNINLPSENNFFGQLSDSASNMVMISGSGPHQQNFQTYVTINNMREQVGSLTYAFYKAMSELPTESDYAILFQKIKTTIQADHPGQIPMIEGDINQQVFSGKFLPKKETIALSAVVAKAATEDTVFRINQGVMDGITEGSSIRISTAASSDFVAEGSIRRADRFIAYGVATKPLKKDVAYVAEVQALNYGKFAAAIRVKKSMDNPQTTKLERQLKAILQPYKFISFSNDADLMLDFSQAADKSPRLELVNIIDSTLWTKRFSKNDSLTSDDAKEILSQIKNSIRVSYLRSMEDGGALAKSIRMSLETSSGVDSIGDVTFHPEELYSLKITNMGSEKLFYTVIDLTPDNQIDVIYPGKLKEAAEYMIEKKSTITRKLKVSKNTPVGREFLKIIVSREPMDLRGVMTHATKRADMSSFQMALDDLFNAGESKATRGDISSIKAEEVGILTVSFMITRN